nr:NADH dehydrogenase subunit 2 [Manota sp. WQY001]
MLNNFSKLFFLFFMILGILISISANSWMGMWMGLEINLLSFIPLMIKTNNQMSTEASIKYFLTQTFASTIFLFSMIIFMLKFNLYMIFNIDNPNNYISIMMFFSLAIKSGISPFHFWFPNVMEGIDWMNGLMLLTLQKIAPLIIISYLFIYWIYIPMIILSALIGAIGGINQTSIKKIMSFSSINHLSWMLLAMIYNEYLWLFYYLIYTILSFSLVYLFYIFKLNYLNQLFYSYNYLILNIFFFISFLSLSGLPPFLGFISKWFIIEMLIKLNFYFILLIMVNSSLITLYFYLRFCFTKFLLNYNEMKFNKITFNSLSMNILIIFSSISIFGLFTFMCLIFNLI